MFDIAPTELLMVALVALIVIGPKDLPKAMRLVGKWVGRARGVARQFRSGIDTMIRESELAEMEKQWKAENERIMREHPVTPSLPAPPVPDAPGEAIDTATAEDAPDQPADDADAPPVMVEQPELRLDPAPDAAPTPSDKASS